MHRSSGLLGSGARFLHYSQENKLDRAVWGRSGGGGKHSFNCEEAFLQPLPGLSPQGGRGVGGGGDEPGLPAPLGGETCPSEARWLPCSPGILDTVTRGRDTSISAGRASGLLTGAPHWCRQQGRGPLLVRAGRGPEEQSRYSLFPGCHSAAQPPLSTLKVNPVTQAGGQSLGGDSASGPSPQPGPESRTPWPAAQGQPKVRHSAVGEAQFPP